MSDGSRRFTDREVALVLKRASEIEETEAEDIGEGSGLSLAELEEIGREVGISADSLRRAVAGLEKGTPLKARITGAPLVQRAVHAVPARLDDGAVRDLVAVIDREVDGAGTLSQALGSVRWTASERLRDTQVRISAGANQTTIEVVEKTRPRLRFVMQVIPAMWGVIAAMPALASGVSAPLGTAIAVASAVAGGLMGRGAWTAMAHRSDERVHRLAESLADQASRSLPRAASVLADDDVSADADTIAEATSPETNTDPA